ncbi:Glycosyltransferase involved in cell wall bisynthesis [Duganella sp. CF402]|nr:MULTISPECIES: glycosyltransferase family 2 protein [unclassified Duganella]RZT08678.1 glycosyltransferase involved in cell wall biosynthesis [Duganella sp. BK701]SEL85684.1 Glycosyltransferase involved in cell wall bisynthesis [Duganella sp. CF402]
MRALVFLHFTVRHIQVSILSNQRIAVIVPCYNEALTIGNIVRDFNTCLPQAAVYVFDNNSSDATIAAARQAGAIVRSVPLQGKGNVIRRMFADVDADIYIMVDGDDTYDASVAPQLAEKLVAEGLDMVVGTRVTDEQEAYRFGHRFGNKLLTGCVSVVFGNTFTDMLSGYRIFSRRYAKSFAAHAAGFETETELTVHALELRMPVAEVATRYGARPEGSVSKLNTYRDGIRILWMITKLFKNEKPLHFFSLLAGLCMLAAAGLALPLLETFLQTGLVPRLPTAVLCTGLSLFGVVLLSCGLILDTVTKGRIEQKRFAYLAIPGPAPHHE